MTSNESETPARPPLILVVDDDHELGKMLSIILGGGGYETHVAYDGRQALAWLADHQPDLVLLDIMMPDMTGFAVLRELRARETGGQMPVVMITAFGDAAAEAESAEAGAQSLLRKPLRPRELLDHIHRLLHPPE